MRKRERETEREMIGGGVARIKKRCAVNLTWRPYKHSCLVSLSHTRTHMHAHTPTHTHAHARTHARSHTAHLRKPLFFAPSIKSYRRLLQLNLLTGRSAIRPVSLSHTHFLSQAHTLALFLSLIMHFYEKWSRLKQRWMYHWTHCSLRHCCCWTELGICDNDVGH